MTITESRRYRKALRCILYIVRALLWICTGFILEVATSIFIKTVFDNVTDDIALIMLVILSCVIIGVNIYKASKAQPMYSRDNDLSISLSVICAIIGALSDNLFGGIICDLIICNFPQNSWYFILIGFAIAGIIMTLDIKCLDKLYEKLDEIQTNGVKFQCYVKEGDQVSYKKRLRRYMWNTMILWIIILFAVLVICIFVILNGLIFDINDFLGL